MKKVLSVLWLATLVGGVSLVWAQQDSSPNGTVGVNPDRSVGASTNAQGNPAPTEVSGPAAADTVGSTQGNTDNQQINTDEGYGANDEEYNSSEGITNSTAPADNNAPTAPVPPAAESGNTDVPADQ